MIIDWCSLNLLRIVHIIIELIKYYYNSILIELFQLYYFLLCSVICLLKFWSILHLNVKLEIMAVKSPVCVKKILNSP